ncbi:hypothetical protein DMB38_04260 [Streptomyces sp. WAC 06738]|uniref:hypothetical protein n=1 Tax=Streptomyces sp. WAC 06738 TaxID=2203210 RepID=UPI000F6BB870|nr:hypothetical protein [Streptomyces sp. WAC 06738]AZM45148.1 hypothetical protein DMB38_04260 [Streptomyces sp. WAC 06738]
MKGITFPAWQGSRYVTLAELVVCLGDFALDLTWRVECEEIVDTRCVEMQKRSAEGDLDTLTLLSLTTPGFQMIDAQARGFAGEAAVVVLTEVDSSSWEISAVDPAVLRPFRGRYRGVRAL